MIDADGSYDNYTGGTYNVLESGALQVEPCDEREEKRIIYGPHGWCRVVVTKLDSPQVRVMR